MGFSEDYDYDPPEPFEWVSVNDRYWKDNEGNRTEFKYLETSHLKNILKLLDRIGCEVPIMLLVELRLRESEGK